MGEQITYKMDWRDAGTLLEVDSDIRVKQVSCWVVSRDRKLVVVSKNGNDWTIPAGHYESSDLNVTNALSREVYEECGLEIEKSQLQFLGYFTVEEFEGNRFVDRYLLLRFHYSLPQNSQDILVAPTERDDEPRPVKFAKFIEMQAVPEYISWAKESPDFIKLTTLLSFRGSKA